MSINEFEIEFDVKLNEFEIELNNIQEIYPQLEDLEITPSGVEQNFKSEKYGYDNVKVKAVESETLEITPTTEEQEIIGLFGTVNVKGVDSSIDSDIKTENIKKGVEILGIEGTLEPKLQNKNVVPKTSEQIIIADNSYDGLSSVSISAVTNEIDENIKAENIKKGTSILGIQGNITELNGEEKTINENGIYLPSENKNGITKVIVDVPTVDINDYFDQSLIDDNKTSGYLVNRIISKVPDIDTSEVTNMSYMFSRFSALEELQELDCSTAVNISAMFATCASLTKFGGLKDLGKAYLTTASANNANYILNMVNTILDHDSLMNVINKVYDIKSLGVASQTIRLTTSLIGKLSDEEKAIATSKGWNIST